MGNGFDSVVSVVASVTRGLQFKSTLLQKKSLACWKDQNKQKEAGNWSIKKIKLEGDDSSALHNRESQKQEQKSVAEMSAVERY